MAFGSPQFLYSSGDASIYPSGAVSGKSLEFNSYAFDSPTNRTGPTNSYGSRYYSTFLGKGFTETTSSNSNDACTYSFWIKKNQDTFASAVTSRHQCVVTAAREISFDSFTDDITNNYLTILFDDKQRLVVRQSRINGAKTTISKYASEMVFRDYSAWYHIVVAIDCDASSSSDRLKVYVNGYQISMELAPSSSSQYLVFEGFGESSDSSQLQRKVFNTSSSSLRKFIELIGVNPFPSAVENSVGSQGSHDPQNSAFLMANLAEFHCIDGQALDASDFGKFVRNVWVPIEYTGSYGNTGYQFKFDDNFSDANSTGIPGSGPIQGNAIKDTSGNSNHFTSYNVYERAYSPSNPTNTFCTLNTNDVRHSGGSRFLRNDNTYLRTKIGRSSNISGFGAKGTMGASSGKWYWEVSSDYSISDGRAASYGISASGQVNFTRPWQSGSVGAQVPAEQQKYLMVDGWGYMTYPKGDDNGRNRDRALPYNGNGQASVEGTIFMIALDLDEGLIHFGKNGAWYTPARIDTDPTFNSSATEAVIHSYSAFTPTLNSFTASFILPEGYEKILWQPFVNHYSAYSVYPESNFNFGQNPTFGGNQSPGTTYADDNGYGEFYYKVPEGFKAWCTQNLPVGEGVDIALNNSPIDYFDAKIYTHDNEYVNGNFNEVAVPLGVLTGTGRSNYFLTKPMTYQYPWTAFGDGIGKAPVTSEDSFYNEYYHPNRRDNETPDGENRDFTVTNVNTHFATLDFSENAVELRDLTGSPVYPTNPFAKYIMYQWSLSSTSSPVVPQKSLNYTGNNSGSRLITHGLGVEPDFMIFHNKDHGAASITYNKYTGFGLWYTNSYTPTTSDDLIDALNVSEEYLVSLRGFRTESGYDNGSFGDYLNAGFLSEITENRFTVSHGATTGGSTGFNGGSSRIGSGALESLNVNGNEYFVQLFANYDGHFRAGYYEANGSHFGVFVYTGFRPAWVLIKAPHTSQNSFFHIVDQKIADSPDHNFNHYATSSTGWTTSLTGRPTLGNPYTSFAEHDDLIFKDNSELSGYQCMIMSNGFMVMNKRNSMNDTTQLNAYSHIHTYAAFADQPYKYANAF